MKATFRLSYSSYLPGDPCENGRHVEGLPKSTHNKGNSLVLQCHKLEVEKIEMQTDQLIREHELRQRDLMIVRYDRQRLLSDEIIIKQKQLIEELSQGNRRRRAKTGQFL